MTIFELFLKNFASIEFAHIDFRNEIVDSLTGKPASIFAISGETGSGKSIILDGVSLSMFKMSPRISNVQNVKKNYYKNNEGEDVQINSIEQYTRLGISPEDESYCEVIFEGNDGKKYRAKLSLGLKYSKEVDENGNRKIRYAKPKWELEVDNVILTGDANIKEAIHSAVGLDFDQFSRMAMLAQGDFSIFLTGKKDEREKVLERLTSTGKFSEYGEMIKEIFARKKKIRDVKDAAKQTAENFAGCIDKGQLTVQKKQLEEAKKPIDKEKNEVDEKINQVNIIEKERENINGYNEKKAKLERVMDGEEYKGKKALVKDWDETNEVRQNYITWQKATQALKKVERTEKECQDKFNTLSADLKARKECLEGMGNPKKASEDKQKEIAGLNEQISALDPDSINNQLREVANKKTELQGILSDASAISKKQERINELEEEISADINSLKILKEDWEKKNNNYTDADAKYNEANSRYSTMNASLDEKLVELRRRMKEEGTEICPLCGQHIESLLVVDEFSDILSPLKKLQQDAKIKRDNAKTENDNAKTKHDTLNGQIGIKNQEKQRLSETIEDDKKNLKGKAEKFGIDVENPIEEQIDVMMSAIEECENSLVVKQTKVSDLQVRGKNAQEELNSLNAALSDYQKLKQTITTIDVIREGIIGLYPAWDSDIESHDYMCDNIVAEWNQINALCNTEKQKKESAKKDIETTKPILDEYYKKTEKSEENLAELARTEQNVINAAREYVRKTDQDDCDNNRALKLSNETIAGALKKLGIEDEADVPEKAGLVERQNSLKKEQDELIGNIGGIEANLRTYTVNKTKLETAINELQKANDEFEKWNKINNRFGGNRFRTLVQNHILRPLLQNANIYLSKITDRYLLTCNGENEQLSIFVIDRYNKDKVRSITLLSGGEKFMISLALSLALSSLKGKEKNVDIMFIDEGFGTLDETMLNSVMETLERLHEIPGQSERRVGIISHREEIEDRDLVKIHVRKKGEGRSVVEIIKP